MSKHNDYHTIIGSIAAGYGLRTSFPGDTIAAVKAAPSATACAALAVYLSGKSNKVRGAALGKLVRSGLANEAGFDTTLQAILYSPGVLNPNLQALAGRYPNRTFNTRQLIKLLGVDSMFYLCVSGGDPDLAGALLAGYAFNNDWSRWTGDLDAQPWREANELSTAINNAIPGNVFALARQHAAWTEIEGILNGTLAPVSASSSDDNTTNTTQGAATMTTTAANAATPNPLAAKLRSIQPALKGAIEAMLQNSGAPGVTLDQLADTAEHATSMDGAYSELSQKAKKEIDDLMAQLRIAKNAAPISVTLPASSNGVIPAGKVDMVEAATLFPEMQGISLKVPAWTWDHAHPDVPAKLDTYIFRRSLLLRALRCLARGENLWLQGHTGSGKTTFVEQIAARLGWPVLRIALDSAIDRSELVGRTQLKPDGNGGTASEWLPGALERAIPNAYILLLDEMDAGHPNSLYTLQPVLEGKGLTLLEDGGRIVPYHPMTRIVATGNTAGSGDESGLYPACRILSAATLDRFAEFIEVPYLTTDEEEKLIQTQAGSKAQVARKLAKFASEMRAAFVKGELPVSYSPRRSIAFARAVEDYLAILPAGATLETACDLALAGKLMQATPNEHRARLTEIGRTCLGTTGAETQV